MTVSAIERVQNQSRIASFDNMAHTFMPEVSVFFQLIGELFSLMVVCEEVECKITELNL